MSADAAAGATSARTIAPGPSSRMPAAAAKAARLDTAAAPATASAANATPRDARHASPIHSAPLCTAPTRRITCDRAVALKTSPVVAESAAQSPKPASTRTAGTAPSQRGPGTEDDGDQLRCEQRQADGRRDAEHRHPVETPEEQHPEPALVVLHQRERREEHLAHDEGEARARQRRQPERHGVEAERGRSEEPADDPVVDLVVQRAEEIRAEDGTPIIRERPARPPVEVPEPRAPVDEQPGGGRARDARER